MFHSVKGKNVVLDRNHQVAVWHPTKTGGCLFTREPITEGKPLLLTLKGTGGVEMGILDRDPENLRNEILVSSTPICGYQFLNDVKIHKRTCNMKFGINNKTKEVTSSYGTGHYSQQIQPDRPYWLAIDVKYGEVELKLQNNDTDNCPQQFSTVHGNNIQLLNDPTVARSCKKSPGSLCFYKQPVHNGLRLKIHSMPKAHQGMVPGRYYVLLSYTASAPEQLRQEYPDLFDLACKKERDSDLKHIEKFEKEDCTGGPITLDFQESDIVYTSASGKVNRQSGILNCAKDVWLAIEVYGVEIRLIEDSTPSTHVGMETGQNVFDARGNLPRQHQSTSYITVTSEPLDITPEEEGMPAQFDAVFHTQENQPTFVVQTTQQPIQFHVQDSGSNQPVNNQDTDDDDNKDLSTPIRKNWTKLLDMFDARQFVGHMFEEGLINLRQMEALPENCTKDVLIILSKRRVRKKFMLHALEQTAQGHLETYFFPESEKE